MLMKTASGLTALLWVLTACCYGKTTSVRTEDLQSAAALNDRVAQFDVTDTTIIDALSKLSHEPIAGLHLGIEEIIRDTASVPTDRNVRFSLSLHDATVRDIIEALCKSDRHYMWSVDGSTVNVYPREIVGKSSYLLNREIGTIALKNINGPTVALTSLMKLLPHEQLGYAGIGVNNDYALCRCRHKAYNAAFRIIP
jgi:hypothetical protein